MLVAGCPMLYKEKIIPCFIQYLETSIQYHVLIAANPVQQKIDINFKIFFYQKLYHFVFQLFYRFPTPHLGHFHHSPIFLTDANHTSLCLRYFKIRT